MLYCFGNVLQADAYKDVVGRNPTYCLAEA